MDLRVWQWDCGRVNNIKDVKWILNGDERVTVYGWYVLMQFIWVAIRTRVAINCLNGNKIWDMMEPWGEDYRSINLSRYCSYHSIMSNCEIL